MASMPGLPWSGRVPGTHMAGRARSAAWGPTAVPRGRVLVGPWHAPAGMGKKMVLGWGGRSDEDGEGDTQASPLTYKPSRHATRPPAG